MEPQYTTIRGWVELTSISRSQTYELLAAGHIRAVKVGTRTLIHLPSALAWLTAQPAARPWPRTRR